MTDILAFVVALPVAVELIAAAYGPIDLARYPRRAALALVKLFVMLGVAAVLAGWLGMPFVLGACAYAIFFLGKHVANSWLSRRRAPHQYPVWSDQRAGEPSRERRGR